MIAIKRYVERFGIYRTFSFSFMRRKVVRSCANLMHVTQSDSARISLDVLSASLNYSCEGYWRWCIKRKIIDDTRVKAIVNRRLRWDWNGRKSGLCEFRETCMKSKFGLGPNARLVGPGEILKFHTVQSCRSCTPRAAVLLGCSNGLLLSCVVERVQEKSSSLWTG
jgi:hypothetical protein